MRAIRTLTALSMTFGAALHMAGCGGDGGTEPTPPTPPANRAPAAVGSIPAQTIPAGESATVDVASNFSDPDGDALTYAAASSNASVASASVSGSNVTITGVAAGSATVTVTARDPGGLTATQSIGVTVEAVNRAPEAVGTIEDVTMEVGNAVIQGLSAFFSDPDDDELTFAATISDTTIATISVSGEAVTIDGIAPGSATVTATATDPGGLSATQEFTATVTAANRAPEVVDAIPAQTVQSGGSATVDVSANFSDPDGDELTFAATSSDTTVATVSVSGAAVEIAAVAPGSATVTVTATDPGGLSATQEFTATVTAANRAPEVVDTIPSQTVQSGGSVTLDVSANFSDPDGDALAYAASSSDGGVATAAVAGSDVTITGIAPGSATVTVTATDPGGLSATQEFTATVTAANRAPEAVDTIPSQTVQSGGSVTLDVSANFSDPDGDALAYAASSSDGGVATAAVAGSDVTITGIAPGSATVTVTATDPGGLSATQEFTATVTAANRAPEVVEAIPAQTVQSGGSATVDVSANFSDPDGDELTFAAASSDTTVATVSVSGATVEIAAVAPGSATITVTATDPGGLSVELDFMVTVAAAAPAVADTIPTHDMIVDSMVPLDVAPYFEGEGLTYTVTTSDGTVATASVDGSVVTTTGVGAVEDSISVATLSITATNSGGSVTQDSIVVRVHQEEYDSLPGISVTEEGVLMAELPGGASFTLGFCASSDLTSSVAGFTIYWTEWQRAVGGGWVTVQNNVFVSPQTNQQVHICPITIEDERFPPGIYRLAGHAKFGDEPDGFYKTPTFEKKPPDS